MLDNISNLVMDGIRTLFYMIISLVYELIIWLYDIFDLLCKARILDFDIIQTIAERIGLILGLVMLFIVIFSAIQMMLDPDKITDKEKGIGNIIKKVILVIVMLALSSFGFRTLYGIQNAVIESNIIEKVFLPNYIIDKEGFGGVLSYELFNAFYHLDERVDITDDMDGSDAYNDLNNLREEIMENKNFSLGYKWLYTKVQVSGEDDDIYIIYFNWLLSLAIGIFTVYFLFSYCITVGIRMVQLAVLEILAPMAIISYLEPTKETMLEKWWKVYFSTYIDVFIRIIIITLTIFLIATVFDSGDSWAIGETLEQADSGFMRLFIQVIIVMALLLFAKKAPDLLKSIFPSGANGLGFGFQKEAATMLGIGAGAALGGTIGLGMSAISRYGDNRKVGKGVGKSLFAGLGGAVSGAIRGVKNGGKKGNMLNNLSTGIAAQRKADNAYTDLIRSGGSSFGAMRSKVTDLFGETEGQRFSRRLNDLSKMDEFKKSMYSAADEMIDVKAAKDTWEHMTPNAGEENSDYERRKADAYNRYKSLRNAAVDAAISGSNSYEVDGVVHIMNDDDQMYATDINATISQANSYSTSHSVEYWDEESGSYRYLGNIESREDLANASTVAHKTETHITSSPEYAAAISNDRKAGVDNNRGSGRKK